MCNYYLLVLFSNLLLLLLLLFGIVVVHLGLREAGDEVVEDAEELVRLGGRRILAEHPANPVEPGSDGEEEKTSDELFLEFVLKTQPGLHVGEEVLQLCKPDTGHGHELSHNSQVAVPWGDCLTTVELHLNLYYICILICICIFI